MLKFDPDDEDDDEGGNRSQSQSTPVAHPQGNGAPPATSSHDSSFSSPTALLPGQDIMSPVHTTPNPAERGNFPYTQQDTRVS